VGVEDDLVLMGDEELVVEKMHKWKKST